MLFCQHQPPPAHRLLPLAWAPEAPAEKERVIKEAYVGLWIWACQGLVLAPPFKSCVILSKQFYASVKCA